MEISVTFKATIPDNINEDDILEWLKFRLLYNGSMSANNPLTETELEADFVDFEVM